MSKLIRDFPAAPEPDPPADPSTQKDALVPGLGDVVLRQSISLVGMLTQGRAPAEAQEWSCGASLRPSPEGSVGRGPPQRLRDHRSCVPAVGVAKSLRQPLRVLAEVDLSNAFNIDRSAVMAAARRHAPGIAPWCDYVFRRRSRLVVGPSHL